MMWLQEGCTPVLGGKLLSLLIAFRIINALVVRTSFTPDEFWQGPEPAHLLAFGTGHLTWEWQPYARIRGFTHPLMFAGVYKALEITGLDTRWAVAHSPKLLQGAMAGVCDYYTFGLALRVFGSAAAGWALLFQVLSWFNFYCLVRPYSNSAEAVLATVALFYWAPLLLPKVSDAGAGGRRGGAVTTKDKKNEKENAGGGPPSGQSETLALLLAALCVAVRPTSAALWAAVGSVRLSALPVRRWPRYLALCVFPPVAAVVGASLYLDSRMYGAATVVPLNFLRFNVLEGKSRIFGEQAWHWNFSQGLPAVLGAALPAALWGFCAPRGGGDRYLGWFAVWFLVYHSTSPHKEFRFLLPVLPIAHVYAGKAVSDFILSAKTKLGRAETATGDEPAQNLQGATDDNGRNTQEPRKASAEGAGTEESEREAVARVRSPNNSTATSCRGRRGRRRRTVVAVGLACLHAPAAVYLSVWHQSGALSAVDAVARRVPAVASAREASASAGGGGEAVVVAVHFLMPCHSAPLHSHLHFGGVETALWSLDCSPNNRELPGGSESEKFESDPLAFLKSTYGTQAGAQGGVSPVAPDLAVMYDTHLDLPGVADYLRSLGLETAQVVFNAHVNGDADSDDTHRSVAVLEKVSCQPGAEGGLEGRL